MRRYFLLLSLLAACGGTDEPVPTPLEIVAESPRQWTGVAVTPEGRIFVNFPRWSDDVPVSVAEVVDGEPVPFPDARWNAWTPGKSPLTHFVCVQSVTCDDKGVLWILDPGNPKFGGVVAGGPKLIEHPLDGSNARIFEFGPEVAPKNSYLNDVRVDTGAGFAYMTDSGAGALVVLDLSTGRSRRLLAGHPSTQAEKIDVVVEGVPFKNTVHADGIALSPDRKWIYYQALTGRTMYRVPTVALRDPEADVAAAVEKVAESGVSDGLIFDRAGHLYLSSLEENAINRLTPAHERERVVHDERLAWPDSFALGRDGWIYVTTAQIHRGPDPPDPYRLWRFRP